MRNSQGILQASRMFSGPKPHTCPEPAEGSTSTDQSFVKWSLAEYSALRSREHLLKIDMK